MPSFIVGFGFMWWNPSGAAKLNKPEHNQGIFGKLIADWTDLIGVIGYLLHLHVHLYGTWQLQISYEADIEICGVVVLMVFNAMSQIKSQLAVLR